MSSWLEANIVDKKAWTDELFSLYFEADVAPFTAGQFCRVALDIGEKRIARPYSFVNSPDESVYEIYFNVVKEGLLSPRLAELDKGSQLFVAPRAAGLFTLTTMKDADNLWLFATGTALGVFVSILKTTMPWERYQNIVLCHGVRKDGELSHQSYIESFRNQYGPRFQYLPFVSREEKTSAFKGRMTDAFISGQLEKETKLTLGSDNSQVMICGNPEMVSQMQQLCIERDLKKNTFKEPGQITIENYWKD